MKTQNERILNWMRNGFAITPFGALASFGSLRLSARIYDIKKQLRKGERIVKKTIHRKGKNFAQYRIEKHGSGCGK